MIVLIGLAIVICLWLIKDEARSRAAARAKARRKPTRRKRAREKIPAGLRYEVLKRDGGECVVDGRKPPEWTLHIDHIVPLSKGGKTTLDNLQTLCAECNLGKGNRDDRDWRS